MATNKGFIKDWLGNTLLPITRGELVIDQEGNVALTSKYFLAGYNGNPYGLITAEERAMLGSGGSGTGIDDIYNKLTYINEGLRFNGIPYNFYNSEGKFTPININSTGERSVDITYGSENSINILLPEINSDASVVTQIVKSISVDKTGRVTSVVGSQLTNEDIPEELSDKTITDSTLNNCSTVTMGTENTSIVNKLYVDSRFNELASLNTGALKWGGPLDSEENALLKLTNVFVNQYYKVTKEFTLNTTYLVDVAGITGDTLIVKVGDTLITYLDNESVKFVYVPSGDDITAITIREGSTDKLTSQIGQVYLNFDGNLFDIESEEGSVTIRIPMAGSGQDGYLSKTDYDKFNGYQSSLSVSYTGELAVESSAGRYKIGTLTIGTTDHDIYGTSNISSLSINNGIDDNEYNPILKFTETGNADVNVTFKGLSGVSVKKNGSDVEINSTLSIDENSNPYLELDEQHKLKVKIGSDETDGLTSYKDFLSLKAIMYGATLVPFAIENSLKIPEEGDDYYYGSEDMIEAITVTI